MKDVIRVANTDNVAVAVDQRGLLPGQHLPDFGIDARGPVLQGHKIAIRNIEANTPILRYGEEIGRARHSIEAGSPVGEADILMPKAPDLANLSQKPRPPQPITPLEGLTFDGYPNPDGSVGTRNILGISTSVQCVSGVVKQAVTRIKSDLLPLYPHVDGVVALNHSYGCGVAMAAPDAAIPIRTLRNLGTNPNLGGELMIVSLGCEKLRPESLQIPSSGTVVLQDARAWGFNGMMDDLLAQAERHLNRLNRRRRTPRPISDLVVGVQCGGSDAFSGITANPAIGIASDLIVGAGGSVMFSEITEVRDAVAQLAARAADKEVRDRLIREMEWYDAYLTAGGSDRSANTTPGNKRGGLANIVEKAMGSVVKSGTMPIVDVLGPGERVRRKGLSFAATPASDFICGTLQLASGINMHVFSTGRGTPYNLSMAPVVKVSSRSELAQRWHDLIDLDAGVIATGESTKEQVGRQLVQTIVDIASGRRQTAADRLGLVNDLVLFNPAPIT